jgi:ABC-type sugar transport system ATPase subunit
MKTTETRKLVSPSTFTHRIDQPTLAGEKQPLLVFDGLVKRYGRTIAVDNLSLNLQSGEVFGFLGPNGAGKTSTIRILCGLT